MFPFTQSINLDNSITEFTFRKVQAPNHHKFFISGLDAKKNYISFDLVMNGDGKWSIIQPAPLSIMQIKDELIDVIKKHFTAE